MATATREVVAPDAAPPAAGELSGPRLRPAAPAALAIDAVSKRFGALQALEDVSLEVRAGEVHCLLGENGAGKSTLCNIVFGVHAPDRGSLALAGSPFRPRGPAHALASGVAMVHQHFSLVGNLSGLENLLLGRDLRQLAAASDDRLGRSGLIRSFQRRVEALGARYGLTLDLSRPVEDLAVGERQRLEVLKCLLGEPVLLVLDEPTAVLPPREVAGLLELCRRIAAQGCGILLVTHKLAEIAAVADRTSVLRRGKLVHSSAMGKIQLDDLVRSMVGRELRPLSALERSAPPSAARSAALLKVEQLGYRDGHGAQRLDLSLEVRAGEIVGLAGVEGNGQSELGAILAGLLAPSAGRILLDGRDVTGAAPRTLTQLGVAIVPDDRHAVACHLGLSVAENLSLGRLERFSRFGLLRRSALRDAAAPLLAAFDVRAQPDDVMRQLSGGNQQKLVLARELSLASLRFLLAAQPTRGLDAGAVEAVYREILRARERGAAVLLVSSELDELLAIADRVLVIYRGQIVGERPGGPDQSEAVGRLMSGQRLECA